MAHHVIISEFKYLILLFCAEMCSVLPSIANDYGDKRRMSTCSVTATRADMDDDEFIEEELTCNEDDNDNENDPDMGIRFCPTLRTGSITVMSTGSLASSVPDESMVPSLSMPPSPEPPEEFECDMCSSVCKDDAELQTHVDAHLPQWERIVAVMGRNLYPEFTPKRSLALGDAHSLFYGTAVSETKRQALIKNLSGPTGINGITHDVLYQTLVWVIDWSMNSGLSVTTDVYIPEDIEKTRKECVRCAQDVHWRCKKCKLQFPGCTCSKPKDWKTHKICWTPVVGWICRKCGKCDYECECEGRFCKLCDSGKKHCGCKGPSRNYEVDKGHNDLYWEHVKELNTKIPLVEDKHTDRDTRLQLMMGNQRKAMDIYCAIRHYPDYKHPAHVASMGEANILGIKGRYQWAGSQVTITALLQTLDMVLMVLACKDRVQINAFALPYVVMMCLWLQARGCDDSEHVDLLARIKAIMPINMDKKELKDIQRSLWILIFAAVLPGHTDPYNEGSGIQDTSSRRWMNPKLLNVPCSKGLNVPCSKGYECKSKEEADALDRLQLFQQEEAKVAKALFQLQDNVIHLDNAGKPLPRVCAGNIEQRHRVETLVLKPEAYQSLFLSYEQRREWFLKQQQLSL